jgi:catechol 2,3-dioxygenase-like lactoylglutathione lyase family enzyme
VSEFLHVSLRSRDRDRTSEWYQKNVGFEEQRRGTTGIGTQTAVLVLPGNNTYIEVSDRVKLGRDFDIPDRAIVLQFTVGDLGQALQRAQANGATVLAGSPAEGYLVLQDADGYEVELLPGPPGRFSAFSVRSSEPEKSATFYTDNFGFVEVARERSPRGEETIVLELPGNNTRLTLRRSPQPIAIPENLMHIALPVADMRQFREEMAGKGVDVDPDGDRMSWVLDPDGYELEMIERR